MKRAFLTTIAALPLLLAACGASEPDPQNYNDVNEMLAAVNEPSSPIQCQKSEQRERPLIHQSIYQGSCIDQNGAEANLLVFDEQSEMDSRVGEAMQRDIWASGDWVILRGPNWTVDCKSVDQCKNWQGAIGGKILGANIDS